jgi:HD-GYP domain-containing protein (c-di-GMP phosphodiesterase class II)
VVVTGARRIEPGVARSLALLAEQTSVALRRVQLVEAQRNFFVYVTDILVAALDVHMDVQAGHARRVAQLSNRMGRELGLDETRRQRLHFAALLHDVGMLRIDPAHLGDPRVARQHPQMGHRMLAPIQLWADVAPLVLHHHEWWDGSGYPEGSAGDAIPLESRVIAVAEAFDSMTSRSSYQEPVSYDEAVRRIEDGAGTQFDPNVVRAFLDLARRGDLDLS